MTHYYSVKVKSKYMCKCANSIKIVYHDNDLMIYYN